MTIQQDILLLSALGLLAEQDEELMEIFEANITPFEDMLNDIVDKEGDDEDSFPTTFEGLLNVTLKRIVLNNGGVLQ